LKTSSEVEHKNVVSVKRKMKCYEVQKFKKAYLIEGRKMQYFKSVHCSMSFEGCLEELKMEM
jgi:hypothetical protein